MNVDGGDESGKREREKINSRVRKRLMERCKELLEVKWWVVKGRIRVIVMGGNGWWSGKVKGIRKVAWRGMRGGMNGRKRLMERKQKEEWMSGTNSWSKEGEGVRREEEEKLKIEERRTWGK